MFVARAGIVVSLLLLTAAAAPAQEMPQPPKPGPEHQLFRMPGPDGKDVQSMRIAYTKRK